MSAAGCPGVTRCSRCMTFYGSRNPHACVASDVARVQRWRDPSPLIERPSMIQPSVRIAQIRVHVEKARYLAGVDAIMFAHQVYLDEEKGFGIPQNHPLRLAEKAAGIPPLVTRNAIA
jgi:hypothetical protein